MVLLKDSFRFLNIQNCCDFFAKWMYSIGKDTDEKDDFVFRESIFVDV